MSNCETAMGAEFVLYGFVYLDYSIQRMSRATMSNLDKFNKTNISFHAIFVKQILQNPLIFVQEMTESWAFPAYFYINDSKT